MISLQPIPEIKPKKKDSNMLGALAYLPFGSLIIPLVIYLVSKEDEYPRFHALNALGFELALTVVSIVLFGIVFVFHIGAMILALPTSGLSILIWTPIFFIIWLIAVLVGLAIFALSFYFMYLAYNGNAFEIPIVTKIVRKYL